MNQLQTHPAPPGVQRAGDALRVVVVAVVAVATVLITMRLVERPAMVDRVTIANPSSLELDIDVGGAPSGDWTPTGAVEPKSTVSFYEVIDQGDTWWIRATAGGNDAVWKVSRAQLERDGWHVSVPTSVSDELVAQTTG